MKSIKMWISKKNSIDQNVCLFACFSSGTTFTQCRSDLRGQLCHCLPFILARTIGSISIQEYRGLIVSAAETWPGSALWGHFVLHDVQQCKDFSSACVLILGGVSHPALPRADRPQRAWQHQIHHRQVGQNIRATTQHRSEGQIIPTHNLLREEQ